MKTSRLVEILKTFSQDEFREFERFIASPYFVRGRNLNPFFKVIKNFYPHFDSSKFTNENIFKKLFPEKKFNDKSSNDIIKTLSHEMIKMCREFFIYSNFANDNNSKNFYLLDRLREKKLYKDFEKFYESASTYQKENDGNSLLDFLDKYYLLYTYNEYCVETQNIKEALETIASMDEIASVMALIRGYRGFENKYLAPAVYNIPSVYNFSEVLINNLDSQALLEEMRRSNNKYFKLITLYYMFYMINEYPEVDEYYFQFKKIVFENLNLFGRVEQYLLLSRLCTYCVSVSDKRREEVFAKEEFEIYNTTLKLGIYKFSDKDDFPIRRFRNILFSALDLNELDWLENFINKYYVELAPDDRENMKNYSLAHLHYSRKEYAKALEKISVIKYNFPLYKIDIKRLMFKVYYDMNLFEPAYSMLETMRQYLAKTKDISESFKLRNRNFEKFAKELIRLKTTKLKRSTRYIENKINKEKTLFEKEWLITKLKELN